ncbi:maker534 [Drosophila busckii]|uniref:Maker534 n=1 Tax=Drosophila busckii TaxID=30019 RepID=A0A0M3QU09_DROBS|nr:maker534 [Drosophila busckii]
MEVTTKQQQITIENLKADALTAKKCEERTVITVEQFAELVNKSFERLGKQQIELRQQLAKDFLETQQYDKQLAKIHEQESTISSLKAMIEEQKSRKETAERKVDKCAADLKTMKRINLAEATSCSFFDEVDLQTIRVPGTEAFLLPCNSAIAGEGWTVIMRKDLESNTFNRTWMEYKHGFGNLDGEFWIGLEKLHLMTKFQSHELYFKMDYVNNQMHYGHYSNFSIGNEADAYKVLVLGKYTINKGYRLCTFEENMKFSTPDRDNDNDIEHCAESFGFGFWYDTCWIDFDSYTYMDYSMQLMIRPINNIKYN